VLKQVDNLWTSRRNDVTNSAEDIHSRLEAASDNSTATNVLLSAEVVRQAGAVFKQSYDPRHGGFGGAPEIPATQPAPVLAALCEAIQGRRSHQHGAAHVRLHGGRGHSRPTWRWLCTILSRHGMARAAFREDAV